MNVCLIIRRQDKAGLNKLILLVDHFLTVETTCGTKNKYGRE